MKLTKRRWFGLALIVLPLLLAVVNQPVDFFKIHSGPQTIIGSGENKSGGWWALEESTMDVNVNSITYFTLLPCLVVGLACLLWPDRKLSVPPLISN